MTEEDLTNWRLTRLEESHEKLATALTDISTSFHGMKIWGRALLSILLFTLGVVQPVLVWYAINRLGG